MLGILSAMSVPVPSEPRRTAGSGRPWLHLGLLLATGCTMLGFWVWHAASGATEFPSWTHFTRARVLDGLTFTLAALAILGAHEMGHYWACRRYGIPATLPYFIPGPAFGTFGAVIRIRGVVPHRRALFDVAAAGPLAGFAVALPILLAGVLRASPVEAAAPLPGEVLWFGHSALTATLARWLHGSGSLEVGPLYVAAWFGLLVTSMNLFPVGQLDGGHAAYAISRSLHRRLTWIVIAALVGFVALEWSRQRPSVYTLWCVVLLWMRSRHPKLLDETEPLDAGRRWLAAVLIAVFALSFMARPLILF